MARTNIFTSFISFGRQPLNPAQNPWTDVLKKETSGEISDKSREDANRVILQFAGLPATRLQMVSDWQRLLEDGNTLYTRLLNLVALLEKADIPSLADARELRHTYVDLLWNSRGIAGGAKDAVDEFRAKMLELLKVDDVTFEDKIAELTNWNEATQTTRIAAVKQRAAFTAYVETLQAYAERVEKEIRDMDSDIRRSLLDLKLQVESTNAEIEFITANVMEPITTYLKLDEGSFAGLLNSSPVAAFAALVQAVSVGVPELAKFDIHLKEAKAKHLALYCKIDAFNAQIRATETTQLYVMEAFTAPVLIQSICVGVSDFSTKMTKAINAFDQLSYDQGRIQQLMRETPVDDPLFVSHVTMLNEVLGLTSALLDLYNKAPALN